MPRIPKAPAIAPVFDHGAGRGATGCIVTAPPVFLTEEDALGAIKEELRRHGVVLEQPDRPVGRASLNRLAVVEERKENDPCCYNEYVEQQERLGRYKADLQDPAKRVVIEFVSREDHLALFGHSRSSVTDYRIRETAEWISRWVKEGGARVYFGVFYDPLVPWRTGKALNSVRTLAKPRPGNTDNSEHRLPLESYKDRKRPDPEPEVNRGNEFNEEAMNAVAREYEHRRNELRGEARMLLRHQVRDFVKWLEAQGAI